MVEDFDIIVGSTEISHLGCCEWESGIVIMPCAENTIILRINFTPKTIKQYSILQHEIFHVVEIIFESLEININQETSECFAGLIEYYTKEIYKEVCKWQRKNQ